MKKDLILKRFTLAIGDILVFASASGKKKILLPDHQEQFFSFLSEGPGDLLVTVDGIPRKEFPPFLIQEQIFSNGSTWSLYRRQDEGLLWLDTSNPEEPCETMALMDREFKNARVYQVAVSDKKQHIVDPLSYPLDQVLMISLLSLGRGVMVHSCGATHRGDGVLFVGDSGSGKSTMAHLWKDHTDATILSDDRIIIRRKNGGFTIYGTPWHGTGGFSNSGNASLKSIYFLRHGRRNRKRRLSAGEAGLQILSKGFLPFWNREGMEFTLNFCAGIAQKIPCYSLDFLPNRGALDTILSET